MQALELVLDEATVIVQGYGNVGTVAASLLQAAGARIIAVSDSQGGVYNPRSLDANDVLRHKRSNGLSG